jgi:hypothetical protein
MKFKYKDQIVIASSKEEAIKKVTGSTETILFDEIDILWDYINQEADLLSKITGKKRPKMLNIRIVDINDAVRKLKEMTSFYEKNFAVMEKMIPDVKLTYRKPNMQLTDGNNSKRIK